MADNLSLSQRTKSMRANKSVGNRSTELRLVRIMRSGAIHGWRRHAELPGKPDFVFRAHKVAVFVDGCFWHGCPRCYRTPGTNRAYWNAKVARNRSRDRLVTRMLRKRGYTVVRIWEHALAREACIVERLRKALSR